MNLPRHGPCSEPKTGPPAAMASGPESHPEGSGNCCPGSTVEPRRAPPRLHQPERSGGAGVHDKSMDATHLNR
jgi:hypothetical protein